MNVSGISGSNPVDLQKRLQDFNALQGALQSGNISNAQSAFAAFQQEVQKTTQSVPDSLFRPGSQPSRDLRNLEVALKSADLAGAQRAFATLKQDILKTSSSPTSQQVALGHYRHHSHATMAANGVESPTGSDTLASAQAAGAVLNTQA